MINLIWWYRIGGSYNSQLFYNTMLLNVYRGTTFSMWIGLNDRDTEAGETHQRSLLARKKNHLHIQSYVTLKAPT